ncbi:DUF2480 family protein [Rudanella paleaurantiibacter]|uniref:DUF2480 family protein n=1 Tax=Rudanella paleaurantiibacter TaxID=2614655 RepID=A0A7J5U271_9BACT|nr:DUF2480 family protein [Rudanella paleaurantiibacter]KAB7731884.1 DUF2480 family protein [Rudanella paleaurantiibacter]
MEIVNRVANSGLVTLDLEELYHPGERVVYDLKDNLYMGLILKEKDFREFLKTHDWSQYNGKNVAVTCSEDAIVPTWAYMLLTLHLQPHAHMVVFGSLQDLEEKLYFDAIAQINPDDYRDARVVVKGCSKVPVPTAAYVEVTRLLKPVVQSLMFGEPCSTVPLFKRPKVALSN